MSITTPPAGEVARSLVAEIAEAATVLTAGQQTLGGGELRAIKRALARITGHIAVAEMHLTRQADLARAAPFLTFSSTQPSAAA